MRLHRRHLRHVVQDRPLDLLRDRVRLLEREVARQLQMERELGARVERHRADVVHLAHARARRARRRARARAAPRPARAARRGRRRPPRAAPPAPPARPGPPRRAPARPPRRTRRRSRRRRSACPAACRIRSRRSSTAGQNRVDRGPRRRGRRRRTRSIRTSTLRRISRTAATRTSIGDEERRERIRLRMPGADEQQPDEDGARAGEVAAEVERVRGERGALVAARGPRGRERPADVDDDHDADDDERVPLRVHGAGRVVREPQDGAPDDQRGWRARGTSPRRARRDAPPCRARTGAPGRPAGPRRRPRRR